VFSSFTLLYNNSANISYRFVSPFHRILLYLITEHWAMIHLFRDVVLKYRGNLPFCVTLQSRGSSVSIATGYGPDGRGIGVRFPAVERNFSLHSVQTGSWAKSASIQWVSVALPLGVKHQEREADQSPPPSAEDNKGRATIPLPHTSSRCGKR
jgi:hypothetical protein